MKRVIAASTIVVAVFLVTAFSAGPGIASSGIPAGLANAIHAKFGSIHGSFGFSPTPEFGHDVAVSADGTTALVGAIGVDDYEGAAYIFHASDAGSWTTSSTPVATLTNAGGFFDELGSAVQLSADGTTAFVGAPEANDGLGAVFVYHVPSEDAWTSSSTPDAALSVNHGFELGTGFAVTPDATTLIVGVPEYNDEAGGAYIYRASSEDAWVSTNTPTALLTNLGEDANDYAPGFAVGISADGSTAILSDPHANDDTGDAWIYHVADANSWVSSLSPTATISDANGAPGDFLGATVGLSGDGTTAFLGAFGVNDYTGAVEVFSSPSEAWTSTSTPVATLSDASGQSGDVFGAIVFPSVDGATVAVAAPGAPGDFDIGAGYVFHAADETSWTSTSTPTATLTDSSRVEGDVLGGSLSFSGDGATVVLGAPGVNDYIGAADVFHASDASSWATASTPNATLTNAALLQSLCIVPALKGLTLRGAKQALVAAGCRGGTVTTAYSSVIPAGRVVLQKTKPGVHLPLGTKVAFKLSLGPFHRH